MLSDYLLKKKLTQFFDVRAEVLDCPDVVEGWKKYFTSPDCWAFFATAQGFSKDEVERIIKLVRKTKDYKLLEVKSIIESVYDNPELIKNMKTPSEAFKEFGPIFNDVE